MSPIVIAALLGILIILVIGGVWGHTIISGLIRRRLLKAEGGTSQAELEAIRTDYDQLEARLGQIEEELEFLRALRSPSPPTTLPSPGDSEP